MSGEDPLDYVLPVLGQQLNLLQQLLPPCQNLSSPNRGKTPTLCFKLKCEVPKHWHADAYSSCVRASSRETVPNRLVAPVPLAMAAVN